MPNAAPAQELATTVYGALSGPDSLHVFPEAGPKSKRPIALPRHPIATGAAVPPNGSVIAAYVVAADGSVVPGSVSILESSDMKFTASVCAVAHRQRFEPYVYEGRARRALVLAPFSFSVNGRSSPPDLGKWRDLPYAEAVEKVAKAPRCPRK
jgi:hypothetical protein